MNGRPPRATRTYTLVPFTTLFRAAAQRIGTGPASALQRSRDPQRWLQGDSTPHSAPLPRRGLPGTVGPRVKQAGRLATFTERSEEHTYELQSLMRISYAVFCLNKKNHINIQDTPSTSHRPYN